MDEKTAKVGMKVKHMAWPEGVYGTITRITEHSFRIAVPFSPQEEGKEYADGGDLQMLRNYDLIS